MRRRASSLRQVKARRTLRRSVVTLREDRKFSKSARSACGSPCGLPVERLLGVAFVKRFRSLWTASISVGRHPGTGWYVISGDAVGRHVIFSFRLRRGLASSRWLLFGSLLLNGIRIPYVVGAKYYNKQKNTSSTLLQRFYIFTARGAD